MSSRMNWAEAGDKVRYLDQNGYEGDLAQAREHFTRGQLLTVKDVDIGNWHSTYTFEEAPGHFNTVMFQPEKSVRYGTKRLIMVFGSNLAGRHGAGAARHAHDFCGAEMGVGIGLTGRAYAIPTKDASIRNTLPIETIKQHVDAFIEFAWANPEMTFQVTPIGCGLAGYRQEEIKPLFDGMPDNCFFSAEWTI